MRLSVVGHSAEAMNMVNVGDRVVQAGEDGKPSVVVEVVGRIERADGVAFEVRPLGNKRTREVKIGELSELVPATAVG